MGALVEEEVGEPQVAARTDLVRDRGRVGVRVRVWVGVRVGVGVSVSVSVRVSVRVRVSSRTDQEVGVGGDASIRGVNRRARRSRKGQCVL